MRIVVTPWIFFRFILISKFFVQAKDLQHAQQTINREIEKTLSSVGEGHLKKVSSNLENIRDQIREMNKPDDEDYKDLLSSVKDSY